MALNTKQEQFIEYYLQLNNATQAAIKAGYSEKTAAQIGSRLLKKVEIASRVSQRVETTLETLKMSADEVLTRLADIARGDIGAFLSISRGGEPAIDLSAVLDESAANRPQTKLIKRVKNRKKTFGEDGHEVEHEIEMYDALDALKVLAKHHRLIDRAQEGDWLDELLKAGVPESEANRIFQMMVDMAAQEIARAKSQDQ